METIPPSVLDRQEGKAPKTPPKPAVAKTAAVTEVDESTLPPEFPATVRAPLAIDLANYTADLPGAGELVAEFRTSLGTITCTLFDDIAPMTVANFVGLARGAKPFTDTKTGETARRPYYNGTIFHRVIPGFMIQGGDPLGVGSGGPGYQFADELDPTKKIDKAGVLAMANAGPGTNGSQFFITDASAPHLNGKHTVFGHCGNTDVVRKIARVKSGVADRPVGDVTLREVVIRRGGGEK